MPASPAEAALICPTARGCCSSPHASGAARVPRVQAEPQGQLGSAEPALLPDWFCPALFAQEGKHHAVPHGSASTWLADKVGQGPCPLSATSWGRGMVLRSTTLGSPFFVTPGDNGRDSRCLEEKEGEGRNRRAASLLPLH